MKVAGVRGLGLVAMALSGITLAGCALDLPKAPPPVPAPTPAGPPVALSPVVSDAASIYVDYVRTARGMDHVFSDGDIIQARLQDGSSYEPQQLARGAIAYAAIVAMQEPSFRASLRSYAGDEAVRRRMVQDIYNHPEYAASLPNADMAARRVILALSSDGEAIYKVGADIKQAAYDVQRSRWSREEIPGRDARLASAKVNSTTLRSVRSDESARLLSQALSGRGMVTPATTGSSSGYVIQGDDVSVSPMSAVNTTDMPPQAVTALDSAQIASAQTGGLPAPLADTLEFDRPDLFNAPYTTAVNRALAVAALAILGEGDTHDEWISMLLDEREGPACFNMTKLNLYQCLAVSKPHYEDVFCLGQHVMMDTAQCIGKMSSNALSLAPVRDFRFEEDGTTPLHSDARPYLQPAPQAQPARSTKPAPRRSSRRRR